MKLATNYNWVNAITSLLALITTGVIYYFVIHLILTDNLDRDLGVEENEIRQYAATYGQLPLPASYLDQQVSYAKTTSTDTTRTFAYTNYYNSKEKEEEPGRRLVTSLKLGENYYRITITKSRVEAEDLVRLILVITLSVTVLLLISLFLINHFLLKRLWQPFHDTLNSMRSFELTKAGNISVVATKIDEFKELNVSVNAMAESVKKDYRELKSFTENAAHEMMTPLAVINLKLDSLLQTESFTDQQALLLQDIYHASGRLSRLHQSLLLLVKIENNLIGDIQDIDLSELIQSKIRDFHELFERDGLILKADLAPSHVKMSKYLADILLNNLFSNAVRHNSAGGEIDVLLKDGYFTISNTGKEFQLQTSVFDRFSKSVQSEGMGLGLAITKQICNLYGFGLEHVNTDGKHYFTIKFNT